jgi:hypothetical protein
MFIRMLSGLIPEAEVTSLSHFPEAVNTQCLVTLPANSQRSNVAVKVSWSYDADPVGGQLTIEDGAANVVRRYKILRGGPGSLTVNCKGTGNTAMLIKLAAAAGVIGTLTVDYLVRA